jgi:hypothetical protein
MHPTTYTPALRRMLDSRDWEGLQNLSRAVYMLSTMEGDSAERRACVAICEQLSND